MWNNAQTPPGTVRPEIFSGGTAVVAATCEAVLCVLQKELLPAVVHLLSAAVVISELSRPAD